MEFDVKKRQTQEQHVNNLIKKTKNKKNENEIIQGFNHLIEDANRRIEAQEKLNEMKEKLDNNNNYFDYINNNNKKYNNNDWEEIYKIDLWKN